MEVVDFNVFVFVVQTLGAVAIALGSTFIAHKFTLKSIDREHMLKERDAVYHEFLDIAYRDKYDGDDASVSAARMQIYGSEKVIQSIENIFLPELERVQKRTSDMQTFRDTVTTQIIPVMKNELLREKNPRWQFWR